jgi:hypothetical protein
MPFGSSPWANIAFLRPLTVTGPAWDRPAAPRLALLGTASPAWGAVFARGPGEAPPKPSVLASCTRRTLAALTNVVLTGPLAVALD